VLAVNIATGWISILWAPVPTTLTLTFSAPGTPLLQWNYLPAFINNRLAGMFKGHKSPLHILIRSIFS